ncbi:MAG: MFS transporter [Chloroflexi bacterium]|nr:MFS transporter [Chloroflexota bacterium]
MPEAVPRPLAQYTPQRLSLWRDPDFLKIWTAQSTSNLGRLMMVIPLVAILVLEARPYQMAIIGGAASASGLTFGLVAGLWIDRSRRRLVLAVTDLSPALAIASIVIAHYAFELHIEHLYVVAFVNGSLGIFNEVANQAYLPSLVERDRLLEANSKMAATDSIVEQIGFSVGGFIAQLASAISAGVVQAITFAISGLLILSIRKAEPEPKPAESDSNIRRELVEGYRFIASNQILLVLAISGAVLAGASGIVGGMIALFALTEIGFQPGPLGVIYGIGGVSSFVGALYAQRVTNKLGVGPTMALGVFVYGVVGFLIPLAPAQIWIATVFFVLPQIFGDGFWIMHDINEVSVQQAVTPEHLRGRVASALKVSEKLAALIGVAIAGVVAEFAGLRIALATGSVLWLAAGMILLHPAVRSLRVLPEDEATDPTAPAE